MNQLTNTTKTMTSLAIAEITGENHKDLMRSIRNMEEAWINLGQRNFALSSYINEQNRSIPMYELSNTECLYIATKFNDEARANYSNYYNCIGCYKNGEFIHIHRP